MENDLFFRIAYLLLWVVFIAARLIPSRKVPSVRRSRKERIETIKQEGIHAFFLIFIAIYGNLTVAALYLLNLPWIQWSHLYLPLELRVVGLILGVVSLPYVYWIGRTLANYYSYTIEMQEDHMLIKTGPYHRIRHPLYSATVLFLAALVLVSDNWLFLVILLAMIPSIYVRMNKEEQMLIEEFGDEYRAYVKRTGRLFPRLRSYEVD
jgi:protein-S-isoprenylcysteine O-methyltransferase Ste14